MNPGISRGPSRRHASPAAHRFYLLAFLILTFLTLPASADAAPPQQSAAASAQQASPAYDGEWWLSLGGWEQYGFLSGYQDCYAFEYRGTVPFTKEIQSYIDDLNKYFLEDPARKKQSVSEALDHLRGAAGDKSASAVSGAAPPEAHGSFDGRFWFDADTAAELGFVEGYVACHAAKVKDADGKFSKPATEYVALINKAYDITDDTDDIDPEKAPIKIAEVLHRLKDESAPAKPGS